MNALIVDDSKAMRSVLCRLLEDLKFKVSEAENGLEALTQIEQGLPLQLILVDWNMPVMSGEILVQKLREKREYSHIKILMVTSETDREKAKHMRARGVDGYIMKPFEQSVIRTTINALVGA